MCSVRPILPLTVILHTWERLETTVTRSISLIDNILDDKPEGKSSADKEEQSVDEIPKRMKKSESTTQSKGKVDNYNINYCKKKTIVPF